MKSLFALSHLRGGVVGCAALRGCALRCATWQRLRSSGTKLPPVSHRGATCCALTADLTQLARQQLEQNFLPGQQHLRLHMFHSR